MIISIYRSILGVVIRRKQHVLYSSILKCDSKEQACRRFLHEQTWRRIERESRLICDSIRSRAKSTLCAKYDRLLGALHRNSGSAEDDRSQDHRNTNILAQNEGQSARVTVIGDALNFPLML